ncbi:ATPase [Amorphus sp. MBR-141]
MGRLRWRQTWPDEPNDGLAKDPDHPYAFGRVYKQRYAHNQLAWYWTVAGTLQIASGFAETKEDAKRAVEEAYEGHLKRRARTP